jgi:hypothetical protein
MRESGRVLITDSIAYLPSSSTPTQTHNFNNHSNGYGRSKTALARSLRIAGKLPLRWLETQKCFRNLMRIMIFNHCHIA